MERQFRGNRERDYLIEPEASKAVVRRRTRCFGGIPVSPVLRGEAPPDLHAGSEMGLERRHEEPHEADEGATPATSTAQGPKPCF